jgi:OOP family OmpA-OmpF porin
MKQGWPWVILLVGLLSIGFYAKEYTAKSIETNVLSNIKQALPSGTRHNSTIDVDGRDISVTGVLHDIAERDALETTLMNIEGRRLVNLDKIDLLPIANPYNAVIEKTDQGKTLTISLPHEDIAKTFMSQLGDEFELDYTLASGMPDDGWPKLVNNATRLLASMEYGELVISNRALSLNGKALERSSVDQFTAFSDQLPGGYTLDIGSIEYPAPYDFILEKSADGEISLSGLAPKSTEVSAFTDAINQSAVNSGNLETIADGETAPIVTRLQEIAPVLADLKSYKIVFTQLSETPISITGAASPNVELKTFEKNLALARLDSGEIEMPKPFDVKFSLDARTGAQLVGLAPEGFDPQEIADNLGLPNINTDNFEVGARGNSNALSDQISSLKPILEDVETLDVGLEGSVENAPEIKAATLPNADPSRVSSFLKEIFVSLTEVDVAPTTTLYTNGEVRINGITGVKEEYQSGYWVALVTVTDASPEGCKIITDTILADRKIEFKSGRALLDPSSRVVINRLTGVISSCLSQTEMTVELSGHTDSAGDDILNLQLSIERVEAVREALVIRGIETARMDTVGYGETRPIADNATKEGRQKNRRTEFDWLQ